MERKNRNIVFDYLKMIGLLCIIFAHISPPDILYQLRNFDVPLMIIVSVMLGMNSIEHRDFNYMHYIIKRIRRLIQPTWIFLIVYFIFYIGILRIDYTLGTIVSSFLLVGGIGYVWIIRIYIYVALVTPLLKKIKKIQLRKFIIILVCCYIGYELLIIISNSQIGISKLIWNTFILDFIGYSFIVAIAIFALKLSQKQIFYMGLVFAGFFIIGVIMTNFQPTQSFKYPIRIYYMSYSFFISFILYSILGKLELSTNRIVLFLSKNSMWIYLWHIFYLLPVNKLINGFTGAFIVRFLILILLSTTTTYLNNCILKKINGLSTGSESIFWTQKS